MASIAGVTRWMAAGAIVGTLVTASPAGAEDLRAAAGTVSIAGGLAVSGGMFMVPAHLLPAHAEIARLAAGSDLPSWQHLERKSPAFPSPPPPKRHRRQPAHHEE